MAGLTGSAGAGGGLGLAASIRAFFIILNIKTAPQARDTGLRLRFYVLDRTDTLQKGVLEKL